MVNFFQCRIDLEDNENREIDNSLTYIEDLDQFDEDVRCYGNGS
jgi:hypothetical protein